METQTFEGNGLPYVLVKPNGAELDGSYPLVVLMHGFGANMHDLASLSSAIDNEGYVYAFPNAPYRMNFGGGQYGYSWLANRDGVEQPAPGAPDLDTRLGQFFDEVMEQTNTKPGNIVLGGFSQGGGQTLRYGLPRPDIFKGLIVLSGAFRDHEAVQQTLPAERTQPIFVAHGTNDHVVDLDVAHRTRKFLEDNGYTPDYHEYPMAHEIPLPVIQDLTPWLHQTLPPKGQ